MDYVGIKDIESTYNNYSKQAEIILSKVVKQLKDEKIKEIKTTFVSVKREILSFFQMICYEEFQRVFYNHYGKNYDVNSLNKSLMFFVDDDLRPHVLYDPKNFIIKEDFNKNKKSFNQNANIEGSFGRLMEFDALESIEEMGFYGLSLQEDSPYDWAVDGVAEIEDARVFNRGRLVVEPKEAYREAEASSIKKFFLEYEKTLKPSLKKRYPSLKLI